MQLVNHETVIPHELSLHVNLELQRVEGVPNHLFTSGQVRDILFTFETVDVNDVPSVVLLNLFHGEFLQEILSEELDVNRPEPVVPVALL
jgi:hypothetical protein